MGPIGHYSKSVLSIAQAEIRQTLLEMDDEFTTADFVSEFARRFSVQYEAIVDSYEDSGRDRPHAEQIAHIQLMHTVRSCFHDLVEKVGDVENPKGGAMSLWRRVR